METVFEGSVLVLSDKTAKEEFLSPGETYFVTKNGKAILTCKKMSPDGSIIIPEENAHCHNSEECRVVLDIK